MQEHLQFYIDGRWVDPVKPATLDVIDPSTEEVIGRISLGSAEDVDRAAKAARAAFPAYSQTTREERLALLQKIAAVYMTRYEELARTISQEMGAPLWLAKAAQAATGVGHLNQTIAVLKDYVFEEKRGTTMIVREPVGVCGLITPWNWPVNQIMCKVAPALAAGCTMVLKPTEIAPLNAIILAEILHEAGVPKGVFNLVNGDGPNVGAAIASHPEIDMVSFTGSTRAGIQVAIAAAPTVKRVAQELGGKSANVILDDADFQKAIAGGVQGCVMNSGQSCNAPTRMLVPASRHDEAVAIAKAAVAGVKVGPASAEGVTIGPVVSELQWNKIQGLIKKGIEEGATLVAGGPGRPDGLTKGYYVKPTIFANVKNDMTIAREEIFGPVLGILPVDGLEQAIAIAKDTDYGLHASVFTQDIDQAIRLARALPCGTVSVNAFSEGDVKTPFGGYKRSGSLARDNGTEAIDQYLQTKTIWIAVK